MFVLTHSGGSAPEFHRVPCQSKRDNISFTHVNSTPVQKQEEYLHEKICKALRRSESLSLVYRFAIIQCNVQNKLFIAYVGQGYKPARNSMKKDKRRGIETTITILQLLAFSFKLVVFYNKLHFKILMFLRTNCKIVLLITTLSGLIELPKTW